MSLLRLYAKNQSVLSPGNDITYTRTYEQFVFDMEKAGTNDLVAKNEADPLFRPPLVQPTYLQTLFKQGVISNRL